MPTHTDDPRDRPLTKADFDELIDFGESLMRECEDEDYAIDCYTCGFENEEYAGCYIPELEPEPEPDKVLEATLTKDAIAKVLNSLPPFDRELLKLRFFEDKGLKEIGERFWVQLGLSGPTGLWGMQLNEFLAIEAAKEKFNQLGINSSKDLLPS